MIIVIPAYEPDEKLLGVVRAFSEQTEFDIVVVNDGSKESCRPVFDALKAYPRVTLLEHEVNRGKGAAMKTAFANIQSHFPEADGVMTVDADGQHLMPDCMKVYEAFKVHPDVLITGSRRFQGKVPFRSRFGNGITRGVFQLTTGKRVYDTQTGLRAFSVDRIPEMLAKGKGAKLTLTGNLGDVMKESAILALEYVKAHAEKLNIDYRIFDNWNIHIHVPEGATPKDGPSAGITIATSIASALTQRKVRKNTAMTGEITLRGKVLPVGGIKEKILAAKRAGITDIVMCRENEKDISEIPDVYLKGVTFHYVENVQDVWDFALTDEIVDHPLDFTIPEEEEKSEKGKSEK